MTPETSERDQLNQRELIERISRLAPEDGMRDTLEGVTVARSSAPTDRIFGVLCPSFCVIAQGTKEVFLNEQRFEYGPGRYLLGTVELPITARIIEAEPKTPYLSFRLVLDPALVGSVMLDARLATPPSHVDAKAIVVSSLGSELLDAVVRLLRIAESPTAARVMLPWVKREVVFWLLMGEQGSRLRHLPMPGEHADRIARAVERLRTHFDQPLRIEALARELGMSPSGFHHHFKAVTDMSPLQFQKQIRLQEARRLLLTEHLDAATAGYRVGYDDASHFSRDYKKLFGHAPMRDVERLRSMVTAD